MSKQILSVILGGGAGTRLYPLTASRSKPAVPIAGKYRLVDIPGIEARSQEAEASRSSMPVGQPFKLQPVFQPAVAQSPEKPPYTCSVGKN